MDNNRVLFPSNKVAYSYQTGYDIEPTLCSPRIPQPEKQIGFEYH